MPQEICQFSAITWFYQFPVAIIMHHWTFPFVDRRRFDTSTLLVHILFFLQKLNCQCSWAMLHYYFFELLLHYSIVFTFRSMRTHLLMSCTYGAFNTLIPSSPTSSPGILKVLTTWYKSLHFGRTGSFTAVSNEYNLVFLLSYDFHFTTFPHCLISCWFADKRLAIITIKR